MNPADITVSVAVELSDEQAEALAQFVKRCSWSDLRINSIDDDEASRMRDAIGKLQAALASVGYAPR